MSLLFLDGSRFSRGACQYLALPAAPGDIYARPFVALRIDGVEFQAHVDTGGFFLILNPELAQLLGLRPEAGDPVDTLVIRGTRTAGHLQRVTLTFAGARGEPLDVQVTAMVPATAWDYPNFLGWPLCLERLRFALEPDAANPAQGWFHFGSLDDA